MLSSAGAAARQAVGKPPGLWRCEPRGCVAHQRAHGARFCIDNRVGADEGDVAEPAMSVTSATDTETFSPEFLSAEKKLLSWAGVLHTAADEIEATVAGLRA